MRANNEGGCAIESASTQASPAAPLIEVSIFHLAVLRAAVEGVPATTYLGSTGALANWIEETRLKGLIVSTAEPTELGQRVAAAVEIDGLPAGPAYLWPGDDALEAAAAAVMADQRVQA